MIRVNKITLVVPAHNLKQEFEIEHAEKILRMQNNGGWQLPENSEFIFDLNNGIGLKQNKGNTAKAKK